MSDCPLLIHDWGAPSLFTPEGLVAAVRAERARGTEPLPALCVLDFDGDLCDALVAEGRAVPSRGWACFHTTLYTVEIAGRPCGLLPRTIGGPYAVLVAEQLAVSGVRLILGLTSAGAVAPGLAIPSVVVPSGALRDEGTSCHYLPPGRCVTAPDGLVPTLVEAVGEVGLPVREGLVWTTDAPYRETAAALAWARGEGALAVEMQMAALFAFGTARAVAVGGVAHVTNRVGGAEEPFDKGPADTDRRLLSALVRAGWQWLGEPADQAPGAR